MSIVSGLVQKLRDLASEHYKDAGETENVLFEAADVIEEACKNCLCPPAEGQEERHECAG